MVSATLLILGLVCAFNAYRPTVTYFKVGGLRFVRVGQIQLSFCKVRKGK